jgi:hypothetical protein
MSAWLPLIDSLVVLDGLTSLLLLLFLLIDGSSQSAIGMPIEAGAVTRPFSPYFLTGLTMGRRLSCNCEVKHNYLQLFTPGGVA